MNNSNVEHQLRIIRIIWVVFLVSQVSFLTALFLAKPELFKFDSGKSFLGETPFVPLIFAFLALTNLILSFFLKSQAFKKAVEEQKSETRSDGNNFRLGVLRSDQPNGIDFGFRL